MTVPLSPRIPEDRPVPIWVAPVMELQAKARSWARLSGIVAMGVGVAGLGTAYYGAIPWWVALIGILLPLVPIAAETRITELGRKLEDQVRDRLMEDAKAAVDGNPRDAP